MATIALADKALYQQITEQLREQILIGALAPEAKLPSESELSRRFQVSRITVRQALAELQKSGLIYSLQGKGTFVAKPKTFQDVTQLQGLAEAMQSRGFEVINRLHSLKLATASAVVAAKLQLPAKSKVTAIKRVRLVNRQVISLEVTYLPAQYFDVLSRADLVNRDIFSILENDAGLALGGAELAIDAILAERELSRALSINEGSPIMRIERLSYSAAKKPIDFEYLYYRGDAFQYRLQIERKLQRGAS